MSELDNHHHHTHDHDHEERGIALRVKALEQVLAAKGLIDPAALDVIVDTYQTKIGPQNGARVVARAWCDPDFKARLLSDGASTVAELGFSGLQGEHLRVVENTPSTHNVIVCTLCSCYPWPVLGLPPTWYKSPQYRGRIVREPRKVLAEFGVTLGDDVAVRVWDSSADIRYMVLPQRPAGTADLDEAALAALVSRDAMIGTALI